MKTKRWLFAATILTLIVVVGAVVFLSAQPPTNLPQKTSGAALYAQHCSGCHHSLESSTKRGRTAMQIETAIEVFAPMNARLQNLTAAEISDIAAALAEP